LKDFETSHEPIPEEEPPRPDSPPLFDVYIPP